MDTINKYLIITLFITGCLIGFYGLQTFSNALTNYLPEGINLVTLNPTEVFTTSIGISFMFGFLFVLPYLLFWILNYSWKALFLREQRTIKKLLPISTLLFLFGTMFGSFVYLYFGIMFFSGFNTGFGLTNMWSFSGVIESLVMISLGFGIAFQLPIIIYFVVTLGIIRIEDLKKARAGLIIGLLVLSAIITPPDIFSQIIIFLPLYGLFEATLFILRKHNSKEVLV